MIAQQLAADGQQGAELAARFRRFAPALKVLYMSGYTDDQVKPHEVEASLPLVKPFSVAELTRRVRGILDAR